MSAKRVIVVFVIILVAIGGFATGLYLLQERQTITEKAAVPGGEAKVSWAPATGNYNVGDTINATISFTTAGIPASGIAVRAMYPFSGSSPEVSVTGIRINSALLSNGNWTCPTQNASQQGGNIVIDIACANTGASGFTSTSDTLLANIDLKVNKAPSAALEIKFDPALSVVTRKTDNQDILLIPSSTGKYTIAGAAAENTPTPTTRAGTATPTPKPTATTKATATPKPTATSKVTATPTTDAGVGGVGDTGTVTPTPTTSTLPDAGVSLPTVFGMGLGIFVILGATLLAL
jgi:hypothetical protein